MTTILERRADRGFVDGDAIPLCSAFAAQDEGSVRQTIRLLYKAGELALHGDDDVVHLSPMLERRAWISSVSAFESASRPN
ncbi:hypothetical protein [Haloferax prahovense]|uniref:hypothetical protein n=1 Tax=Haloferax prahovense TaxID=381852 RepID=UPI00373AE1E6